MAELSARWGMSSWRHNRVGLSGLVGAATLIVCGVVSVLAADGSSRQIVVGALMVVSGLGLALARHVLPMRLGWLGVAITITAGLAVTLLAPNGLGVVPVLIGTAAVQRYVPAGPRRDVAIVVVAIAFGVVVMIVSRSPIGLLAGAGAWLLATGAAQRGVVQAERDRAVALLAEIEASRQAQEEAVAAEERSRIAAEMHDVLAHSLAGLSIKLQAVRAIAAREGVPAAVTDQLDSAAELARDGLHEAQAAVGALRDPQRRGVDDLARLIGAFPGKATLESAGPAGHVDAEAAHAVYRSVQEAMTNAARYATGSRIDVEVRWETAALRVRVRDGGVPPGRRPSGVQGSGTGLAGMAERIESVGGTLTAGPEPQGSGWCVEVRVPTRSSGKADA